MRGNLTKEGLPRPGQPVWRSYVEEWDRALRAANHPQTTRYNYELAVTQLADFLAGDELPKFLASIEVSESDESDAGEDPTDVERRHVEWFMAWMIQTRSASTAVNKYKSIQQFFRYLLEEEEITRSPMERTRQPGSEEKLVPVLSDEELAALLGTCAGKGFAERRDTAIIRLLMDTGGRLTEITTLVTDAVDLRQDLVVVRGKGDWERAIPFGAKTGQALTRYLRVRARHKAADLPELFLAERGRRPLSPNGVKIMLRRRGEQAGIANMHAHRLRHTLAHQWQLEGGNETDLMAIMGWQSAEMLRRYGKSAAAVRAQHSHRNMRLGDRV